MVLHIYCVVSGGIPVLYRTTGQGNKLSFSELAPLNGIQVFGKVHSVTFKSAEGKDFNVHWKNCTEKVSLILVSKFSVLLDGEFILESIFDSLVLTVGIEDLTNVKHVDRLKKEIRPAYPLIDEILRSADEFSKNTKTLRLLGLAQMFPCASSNFLLEKLEDWSESISSLFCCLTVDNKLIVATPSWWDLTASERSLISILMAMHSDCTTIDIPVFLPAKSPTVAFRLVCSRLMSNIWISALCGPTPSILEFEQSAAICWSPAIENLNDVLSSTPPTLPDSINIHNGIQGALLINFEVGNYIILGSVVDDQHLFDVLRIFYYQNVRELLDKAKNERHKVRESYWYTEENKLHAIFSKPYVLCVITTTAIPIPSVRFLSKEIMDYVMNNKTLLC